MGHSNDSILHWHHKHLLSVEDLSVEDIQTIFIQAQKFKKLLQEPIPHTPLLQGTTIIHLFCEPSTRTRVSFELAAKRLEANVINFDVTTSAFLKGETLKDTVRNIEAMRANCIVVRHRSAGAPYFLSQNTDASIINAGDGCHEHPTQALLDAFTLQTIFKDLHALNVCIVGDIAHSRVAKSEIFLLKKLGAHITLCGPKTLLPQKIEQLGVHVTSNIKEALKNADVVNALRIQLERQKESFLPTIQEYRDLFGLTLERIHRYAKPNLLIMHPGPINRELELTSEIADGPQSVILQQVLNGVAIRMALLSLLAGGTSQ